MVTIARSSMARIIPRDARLPLLILTVAITIPFSVFVHTLKVKQTILKAIVHRDAEYYFRDYIIAVALVEPSQDAELNRFVASRFGEAAMCSWSEKAVTCKVDNVTIPFAVMKYSDASRELL